MRRAAPPRKPAAPGAGEGGFPDPGLPPREADEGGQSLHEGVHRRKAAGARRDLPYNNKLIGICGIAAEKSGGGRMMIEDGELEELIAAARKAARNAYPRYSNFPVGAAVLAENGEIYAGCNVENASYGLTICAERNAVFHMVAEGRRRIRAVAIFTPTKKPSAPCGACRQVIREFGADALVVSVCDGPDVLKKNLADLLPDSFGPENLA
jgi:cytidine deaminase